MLASTAALAGIGSLTPRSSAAESEEVMLRAAGQRLFRVRVEMDVKGNVNVPKNPLISRESERKLPIVSNALFDYEERYLRPADADENSVVTYVERYYHEAKNDSDLNRNRQSRQLRDSVKRAVVRRESLPEVIYGIEDYFQRDELDLLRVPVSSASVDELLPTVAVQTYSISNEVMASVLNLTAVVSNDVAGKVISISDKDARIELQGQVDGSVDGVPTVIRTVGKLVFDRSLGTCTWLAIAVHETREIGKAEPGFDVAATIKMVRKPLTEPIALMAQATEADILAPIPADRLYVDLFSEQLGISVLMDRSWRFMLDAPGTAMMRMIENDRSIAQCDFRPLAQLAAGEQWTLEAFQEDVKRTLGEQLVELVEADQSVSDTGLRVLRVTAAGAVEGVPIRWIVNHFSDDTGRRVLATFTMEGHHVERFAGADTQLANSLQFTEQEAKNGTKVSENADTRASVPRVAQANSGEDSKERVQSPSDL
jgi:hypothetical protein